MTKTQNPCEVQAAENGRFNTTQWTVVMKAAAQGKPEGGAALAALCKRYWSPIYVFIRRKGYSAADAQDLTQEFLATLLEKQYLRTVDQSRGRFRTFLLTAVTRFLAKELERTSAQKRGGGQRHLSSNFSSAEDHYQLEPMDRWTPERLFERRWALTLLQRVLDRLRADYAAKGKGALFDALKSQLTGDGPAEDYAALAVALQMTPNAIKVASHRLRRRYGELLKEEIVATVADASEVEQEIASLLEALRDPPAM